MEGKGRVGSSSSSSSFSFTAQLFGPKEPSSFSNFNSIFPPPSKGTERNILSSKHEPQVHKLEIKPTSDMLSQSLLFPCYKEFLAVSDNEGEVTVHRVDHVIAVQRIVRDQRKESTTCNLSSSLYYGGQDVYSRSTNNHTYPTVNKAGPRNDDSGNNSLDASRGNWWQGSLYY